MLQAIRDRATGWIAWAIVILISIPFALWGIQQYMVPEGNVTVASVNGAEIGYPRYQSALARREAQLRSMLGAAYRPELIDGETLRKQTIEALVSDELVVQFGLDDGLRVGDAQLARAIRSQDVFRQSRGFDQAMYESWLRGQGYTPGAFEFDLRRSLLSEQLISGLSRSDFATAGEVDRMAALQAQKRVLSTLVVARDEFLDAELDDDAIRAYFDEHRDRFVAPERLELEFVMLTTADAEAAVEVDEEMLRQLYDDRKDSLFTPEQRDGSHILVTLEPDAEDAEVEAARAKLTGLKARVETGESFADLAREHSEDIGSAQQGGELGAFSRGVMDPAFEEAAFALVIDEISEPVRSSFGMHLIKVTAIQPSGARPFEEVSAELEREFRGEQAEQLFYEQTDRLVNLTYENQESLEPAADALGIEIGRTGLAARGDAGAHELLRSARVWAAALGPKVYVDRENSEMISLESGDVAVIRLVEHVPEAGLPFEEARADAEEALRGERAVAAAREAGEALVERLKGGADPQTIAEEARVEWSEERVVDRSATVPDSRVVKAAFRLSRPAEGEVTYDGVELASGDFVVVALKGLEEGAGEALDGSRLTSARATMASDLGRRSFGAVLEGLRSGAEIVMRTTDSLDEQ